MQLKYVSGEFMKKLVKRILPNSWDLEAKIKNGEVKITEDLFSSRAGIQVREDMTSKEKVEGYLYKANCLFDSEGLHMDTPICEAVHSNWDGAFVNFNLLDKDNERVVNVIIGTHWYRLPNPNKCNDCSGNIIGHEMSVFLQEGV